MIRFGILIIVAFVLANLMVAAGYSLENSWEETFIKANMDYRQGRFQEAADGYNRLIRSGYKNGNIYYNLGNAFFRMDRPGYAILNYERARTLIPRDPDLNFNLKYARDRIQDAIEQPYGFGEMIFFWIDSTNINELFYCFAFLNLFFWSILLIRIFNKNEWTYYTLIILFILWLISGASLGLKWHLINSDNRSVILEKEVNILAGPDAADTVLFKLHEGAVVHHERSEEGWSLISLPDSKRGWIKGDALDDIKIIK